MHNLIEKNSQIDINKIDMIIVATTSTNLLMPGISYEIQEHFDIKNCMCLDILAGCSGFINAIDIARNYIAIEKVSKALVVGVDILSKITDLQYRLLKIIRWKKQKSCTLTSIVV